MSRRIEPGGTTSVVISSPWIPARAITSASPSFAQATPRAPAATWRRAISGHLWVLAWGRIALPARRACPAIVARFFSKRSRSRSSAGVGISSRVIAGSPESTMLDSAHARPAVPPDPGAHARARADRARHVAADHRPPRAAVRGAGRGVPHGLEGRVPDRARPRHPLSGLGHRRVGGGARQHALAGRPRAGGGERPLLDGLRPDGRGPPGRG